MEWFNGNVTEALNEYQQKRGILIVYIYGENEENSLKFNDLWCQFDATSIIKIPYVAIRLLKESEGAKQFAEFFPIVATPICYILGKNAQPLEVCTALEELTAEHLNNSFSKAIKLYTEQLKDEEIDVDSAREKDNNIKTGESTEMTKEEKIKRYRKLLEEKKKNDAKKNEEEERAKEIQRRNEGKALAELREKQREVELREAAEARRKQKETDAQLLQKLRDQIKADKEERVKRSKNIVSNENTEVEKSQGSVTMPINKPIKTDECKIQCRFPDGSTLNLNYRSKEPLQVVYDAVNQDPRKPNNFFLVQTYPRKKLTEMSTSLLDHGLTPSAVVLVISNDFEKTQQYGLLPSTGYLNLLYGFIYFPFIAIYRLFVSLTGGNKPNGNVDNKKPQGTNSKEDQENTFEDGDKKFRSFKKDDSDHSDTEATWNGNSTQQL